ncbi:hypothetical protein D3C80_1790400 [compost metagenome]
MQTRTQPGGDLARAQCIGQRMLRYERAVGQVTCHAGWYGAQQLGAGAAPQSVCADQRITLDLLATAGAHGDDAIGVGECVNGVLQMQLRVGVLGDC